MHPRTAMTQRQMVPARDKGGGEGKRGTLIVGTWYMRPKFPVFAAAPE